MDYADDQQQQRTALKCILIALFIVVRRRILFLAKKKDLFFQWTAKCLLAAARIWIKKQKCLTVSSWTEKSMRTTVVIFLHFLSTLVSIVYVNRFFDTRDISDVSTTRNWSNQCRLTTTRDNITKFSCSHDNYSSDLLPSCLENEFDRSDGFEMIGENPYFRTASTRAGRKYLAHDLENRNIEDICSLIASRRILPFCKIHAQTMIAARLQRCSYPRYPFLRGARKRDWTNEQNFTAARQLRLSLAKTAMPRSWYIH